MVQNVVYVYWIRSDQTREGGSPQSAESLDVARHIVERTFRKPSSYVAAEIVDPEGRILKRIDNPSVSYPEVPPASE
jgi:hypothetical protein